MNWEQQPFLEALRQAMEVWELTVSPHQLNQLYAHYEAILHANRTMNLTRITDPVDAAWKHYADSMSPLVWLGRERGKIRTVLDIGTGAGFPAVPLAVMCPNWQVIAIDAIRKKIDFVRRAALAMSLPSLSCEHAHSNHWRDERRFDLVTFRALGSLDRSLRAAATRVAKNGWLIAFQTPMKYRENVSRADRAAADCSLRPFEPFRYDLVVKGRAFPRLLAIYRRHSSA